MSDDIRFVYGDETKHEFLTIYDERDTTTYPWHIIGDLRAPGSGWSDDANYEARDTFEESFPDVDFDPESSCFYAYAETQERAMELAEAVKSWVQARRGLTNSEKGVR